MSYYPEKVADLIPWHDNFNTECINYAGTFPDILTAGTLAKILGNKTSVATLVNAAELAKNYSADIVAYRDIWLSSPSGTPIPAVPVPPAVIAIAAGTQVGIEAYTRGIVAQLKAHPGMTPAIEAAMGIESSPAALGSPSIVSAEALGNSAVRLRLRKGGYPAVAVTRTRAGVTEEIGISLTAEFIDSSAPLSPGVSEVREYTVQGVLDNVEQGPISASVQIATTP